MDPYGKRELLAFFDRHLRDHGDTPQALRWTPAGQLRRYEVFRELLGEPAGRSILDFGCGKGDFLGFLREHGADFVYSGVDVNPNLIDLARRKHPGSEFLVLDIEEEDFDRRFDIVLACGVFNLRFGGIAESTRAVLRLLFERCRQSLHADFLSDRSPGRDVEMQYANPEELTRFAREELSEHVVVHDWLVPGAFVLSVHRTDPPL